MILAEAPMADLDAGAVAILLGILLAMLAIAVLLVAVVSVAGIYAGRALAGRRGLVRPSVGAVALCTVVACAAGVGAASLEGWLTLSAVVVAFVLGGALGAFLPAEKKDGGGSTDGGGKTDGGSE